MRLTQSDPHHSAQLGPIADHDRQHHRVPRRPEDLAVHELPAPIFLYIFLCR